MADTATDKDLAAELGAWLDQQPSIPCDWLAEDCQADVTWRLTTECCGATWFFCDVHRAATQKGFDDMAEPVCSACESDLFFDSWTWQPI